MKKISHAEFAEFISSPRAPRLRVNFLRLRRHVVAIDEARWMPGPRLRF